MKGCPGFEGGEPCFESHFNLTAIPEDGWRTGDIVATFPQPERKLGYAVEWKSLFIWLPITTHGMSKRHHRDTYGNLDVAVQIAEEFAQINRVKTRVKVVQQ